MLGQEKRGFLGKLKLYLFGVVLGVILSYFLLIRNKDLTYWTPERQVTMRLGVYHMTFSDLASCQMKCNALNEKIIKSKLDSASVDFKNSAVADKPCPVYSLTTKDGIGLRVVLCDDSTSKILEFKGQIFEDDTCKCK